MFLCNWVRLYISIPLTIGLIYAGIIFCKNLSKAHKKYAKKDVIQFIVTLFLLFILAFLSGITGNVAQHGDLAVRNPIYFQLIDYAWPQRFPDGHMFIYYFSFWLPPAFVSHLFDFSRNAANWLLLAWMTLALWLAFTLYFVKSGKNIFKCLLFVLLMQTFCSDWVMVTLFRESFHGSSGFICVMWQYSVFVNIFNHLWFTFNNSLPLIVISFLIFLKYNGKNLLLLLALAATCSPLGAIGFLPFAMWKFFTEIKESSLIVFMKEKISIMSLVSILLVLIMFVFYSSNSGGGLRFALMDSSYNNAIMTFSNRLLSLLVSIIAGILPVFLMYWKVQKDGLFKVYISYMIICPFIFVGLENNELLFKSILIPYLFFAVNLAKKDGISMKSLPRLAMLMFFCTMPLLMRNKLRSITFDGENIAKNILLYEGEREHLYAPQSYLYSRFVDKKNLSPYLFIIPDKMVIK